MDFYKTVCEKNKCDGCKACVEICPKKAIHIEDSLYAYNAVIDELSCIDCNRCYKVCQRNYPVKVKKPLFGCQGWTKEEEIRCSSSSGGFAASIAQAFIKHGGFVCSCFFEDGEFTFKIVDNVKDTRKFSGSKYVKSDPQKVYKEIRQYLLNGEKILFIGLPCQVAAVKRFAGKKGEEQLYTIDLICHGTPSPKLLEYFLNQYHCSLKTIKEIQFRRKNQFQIADNSKSIVTKGICDRYTIAFLNSLDYTNNCYECNYAKYERASDLTIGDSWGSELSDIEQQKGISLALCQTKKGKELLDNTELHIETVNLEKAIKNNQQLNRPSKRAKGSERFFERIKNGENFNRAVFYCLPAQCLKQEIKAVLIKGKLLGGGNAPYYEISLIK